MARSREFEVDEALERAMLVFWSRGYRATSLQDLVDATGVARAGLYAAFGDKHGLFLACLKRYGEAIVGQFFAALREPDAGVHTIRAVFQTLTEIVIADPEHRSCFNVNTTAELGLADPSANHFIRTYNAEVREHFRTALLSAQARGELDTEVDVDSLSAYLSVSAQGLLLQARSGAPPRVVRQFVEVVLAVFPNPTEPPTPGAAGRQNKNSHSR